MTPPTNSQTTQISAAYKGMESYQPSSNDAGTKAAWGSYKQDYAGAMGHTGTTGAAASSMPPQVTAYGGPSPTPPAATGPLGISAAYKAMESTKGGDAKTQWNSFKTNYGAEMSKGAN